MGRDRYIQDLLAMLTGRQRAALRGRLKRRFGLNRRQVGAIGAGHLEAPEGYEEVFLGVLELIRFRRATLAAATPSRRPSARRKRRGGVYERRAKHLELPWAMRGQHRAHREAARLERAMAARRNP